MPRQSEAFTNQISRIVLALLPLVPHGRQDNLRMGPVPGRSQLVHPGSSGAAGRFHRLQDYSEAYLPGD